ncbi:CS domain-containing protein [Paenibacillus sp. GCM10027626]|uniref:CS domain-containing protein n=1 Tax=Paenibacillus sp. GCM10027626 TaxID=3273411 RepID=UPI003634C026
MARKNDNNPLDHWSELNKVFGLNFPLPPHGMHPDQIDDFVNDVLSHSLSSFDNLYQRDLRTETFETHQDVIIKVKVPDEEQARNLRVFINPGHVKLEGLPGNRHQIIKLPALVNVKQSRALLREETLQIKIRKLQPNENYHETFIRYL